MNKTFLLLMAATLLISSCRSTAAFETPNSLRNMAGTLFLTNGKSIDGKLVIQMGNIFGSDVKVYTEDEKKPMQFGLADVEGYRLRNDYYALKEKRGGISLGRRLSFMKRLTLQNSRIHLYEELERTTETRKVNNNNYRNYRYETEYYLQLPNETGVQVYPLGGSAFVPNFDEKMSRLVSDCPSLARKIAAKENGYFYAQVSLFNEKKAEVLLHIIDEYNRCR